MGDETFGDSLFEDSIVGDNFFGVIFESDLLYLNNNRLFIHLT